MTGEKGKGKGKHAELQERVIHAIEAHPNYRDKKKGDLPKWLNILVEANAQARVETVRQPPEDSVSSPFGRSLTISVACSFTTTSSPC